MWTTVNALRTISNQARLAWIEEATPYIHILRLSKQGFEWITLDNDRLYTMRASLDCGTEVPVRDVTHESADVLENIISREKIAIRANAKGQTET